VDPFVEFDHIVVALDALRLRLPVYRHILWNNQATLASVRFCIMFSSRFLQSLLLFSAFICIFTIQNASPVIRRIFNFEFNLVHQDPSSHHLLLNMYVKPKQSLPFAVILTQSRANLRCSIVLFQSRGAIQRRASQSIRICYNTDRVVGLHRRMLRGVIHSVVLFNHKF
jgi:hypothetical protein